MAPLRRYLRITPTSVLEVRIYLDNPADAHRWLLNEKTPMLGRVVEAVRPLVLPKLREENENSGVGEGGKGKGKGKVKGKRKGVKDVVVTDDFEVSIFLTELSTRHSILTKRKVFKSEKPRLGNTDGRMTGETRDRPVEIGGEEEGDGQGVVIREEEDEEEGKEGVRLRDIPAAAADEADGKDGDLGGKEESGASSKKRRRGDSREEDAQEEEEEEEEPLFLSDDSAISDTEFQAQTTPPAKRHKPTATTSALENEEGAASDEKKKMALNTTYDGYAIYGRILCLIVKRRGVAARGKEAGGGTGQAVMEEWVRSTQVGGGEEEE